MNFQRNWVVALVVVVIYSSNNVWWSSANSWKPPKKPINKKLQSFATKAVHKNVIN